MSQPIPHSCVSLASSSLNLQVASATQHHLWTHCVLCLFQVAHWSYQLNIIQNPSQFTHIHSEIFILSAAVPTTWGIFESGDILDSSCHQIRVQIQTPSPTNMGCGYMWFLCVTGLHVCLKTVKSHQWATLLHWLTWFVTTMTHTALYFDSVPFTASLTDTDQHYASVPMF